MGKRSTGCHRSAAPRALRGHDKAEQRGTTRRPIAKGQRRAGERPEPQRFNAYDRPHDDLREFIARAERAGEIVRIKGADWKLEMGTLAEIVNHARPEPPAILFEDVPGYPKGMRLLSGATNSSKRLAITLGLPVPDGPLDVVRAYRDRMKTHRPIPPKTVGDGPGVRERRPRRQGRPAEIPGAVPARARRRPLHRHRRSRDHARSRGATGSTAPPIASWCRTRTTSRCGSRPASTAGRSARNISRAGQALPGADLAAGTIRCCSSPAATSSNSACPNTTMPAAIAASPTRSCRASCTACRCRRMPRSCSKAR